MDLIRVAIVENVRSSCNNCVVAMGILLAKLNQSSVTISAFGDLVAFDGRRIVDQYNIRVSMTMRLKP